MEEKLPVIDENEMVDYILDELGQDSKLSKEDIFNVLVLEMDFLRDKGLVEE